jgi:hypothetical protein
MFAYVCRYKNLKSAPAWSTTTDNELEHPLVGRGRERGRERGRGAVMAGVLEGEGLEEDELDLGDVDGGTVGSTGIYHSIVSFLSVSLYYRI